MTPGFFLKILISIFQSINMDVDHKLLLQLLLTGFYLFCSKIVKRYVLRFHLISGYCLDDQCNFHTLAGNPQQILAYSWYIFKSFIKSFFQTQNMDDCKFNHYLNSPNF